jgi:S-adenosylmethionine:tRNA ribosyltransferase-isomerase
MVGFFSPFVNRLPASPNRAYNHGMHTADFDYHLPPDRIAQRSVEPRDHARLLCLGRKDGTLRDAHIFDLPSILEPGDLLVFNNSKVFKARLSASLGARPFEVFLLRPAEHTAWEALVKPGRKLRVGDRLSFVEGVTATLLAKTDDGTARLEFHLPPADVFAFAERHGQIPSPPYVEQISDASAYQTTFAKTVGSVAAPTAGFHFTPNLLATLADRGVDTAFVTLHVGLGTFRPMKTETIEEHVMHSEWAQVPQETVDAIARAKARGNRVVVVGTTALRALESAARSGALAPFQGFTDIFITPGYTFRVADALLTNFHLPKSTLLVLVSAFADRVSILNAYQHAIDHGYRFYSFGDAMLIG